ncbi:hypothetical protein [Luteolibacter sp. Populi]|uniref:hypothetical protein n=1 Tax=Luteolibacter sp. Populi TaxID=3230487 RepID=UPI00346772CA
MDPITTITTITAGLELIDKFRDMALSFMRKENKPPSVEAKKKGTSIEISMNGHVTDKIDASQLRLSAWDQTRYSTLEIKVKKYWKQFNDIDAAIPDSSIDERTRLEIKRDGLRGDLCIAFREMLKIYEGTLGVQLGDHYSLYSVCGDDCLT